MIRNKEQQELDFNLRFFCLKYAMNLSQLMTCSVCEFFNKLKPVKIESEINLNCDYKKK
jgi:hypothetical protein